MECQDQAEVDRIHANVEKSRKALQTLGYADLTFEDFFAVTYQLHLHSFFSGVYVLLIILY